MLGPGILNLYPGETRIRPDLLASLGPVSFNDTDPAPSPVPARFGQKRLNRRLQNISDHTICHMDENSVRVTCEFESPKDKDVRRTTDE